MARSMPRNDGTAPGYAGMGDRLRAARAARGYSLRALADRVGLSASLISQVETGRAKPSVSTLYAIASELGVSLDELLFPDATATLAPPALAPEGPSATGPRSSVDTPAIDAPAAEIGAAPAPAVDAAAVDAAGAEATAPLEFPFEPLQPATSRARIRLASGVVWERLTTVSMPNVDFLYVTYEVGGASSDEHEFQRHKGQEWGYILSGTLGVTVGFEEYVLRPGDAISFESSTPHRLYNAGDEPVHAIWFVLGRRPVDMSAAR